jgi:MSHA pilin protein MshB
MKHAKKQQGFTIIELVVVILLLGILTATALPRFMDVTDDAHDSVVSAVVGGLATGTSLYKAQWYAKNQPATVTEFGGMLANKNGYPLGIVTGAITNTLLSSVGSSQHCKEIFENLLQPSGRPTIAAKLEGTDTIGALAVNSGTDFIAYLESTNSTTKKVCNYVYTGQYTNNTLYDLPVISYDALTGTVVQRLDI